MKDERTCTMRRDVLCPSLVNDDLVRKVKERVRDDRRFTISDLVSLLSSDFKDSTL